MKSLVRASGPVSQQPVWAECVMGSGDPGCRVNPVIGSLGQTFRTVVNIQGDHPFMDPAMIEEATRKAREVAQKFAQDSDSSLGKIKTARQGQFTINDRDSNTPHIKNVRVVATLEYYLND